MSSLMVLKQAHSLMKQISSFRSMSSLMVLKLNGVKVITQDLF